VLFVCNLAQAMAGSLSESSMAYMRLTDLVGSGYVCNDWLVYCFKKFKYNALYVLYDIMGLELISLV